MAPRKGYRSANDPNHEEYPVTWEYDRAVTQGNEYFNLGQYQQAIKEYDKAISGSGTMPAAMAPVVFPTTP